MNRSDFHFVEIPRTGPGGFAYCRSGSSLGTHNLSYSPHLDFFWKVSQQFAPEDNKLKPRPTGSLIVLGEEILPDIATPGTGT